MKRYSLFCVKFVFFLNTLLLTHTALGEVNYVYFGTSGQTSEGIYRGSFDSNTGELSDISLAHAVKAPGFLAVHPSKPYLYAVAVLEQTQTPSVFAYAINTDGSLTLLNSSPIGDGRSAHISVHPSGEFLLTAQYNGGSVAVFPIKKSGKVGKRKQLIKHEGGSGVVGTRQDSPHPHWVGWSPDARFAFVPDLGMDQILIYEIEKGSNLKARGFAQTVAGGGPRHMRFSIDGRFIYLLNELSLSVSTFAYDAEKGTTQRLTTTPALSEEVKAKEQFNSASEILVHPNGKFVYSGNRGNDSVTVYSADVNTGKLDVVEVESIRGSWPRNINLDPSGKWLLAAGAHSNTISIFAVDSNTGELQFKTKGVSTVPEPICIVFVPKPE